MLYKSGAIVLRQVDYGDASKIVTLYTENHGRISCMVNGVRSKKPRFAPTLFQPLTLLEIDFYYRPGREVQRLKEAVCPFHYQSILYDHVKSSIAIFLAEVLYQVLREEESNLVLFSFIYHALQLLDTSKSGITTFHHWFMLHLSRYLGFYPDEKVFTERSYPSDYMQAFAGLTSQQKNALRQLAESPQSSPELSDLTHSGRNELLESIIRYYTIHIDGISRLRSLSVLQEVFGTKPVSRT